MGPQPTQQGINLKGMSKLELENLKALNEAQIAQASASLALARSQAKVNEDRVGKQIVGLTGNIALIDEAIVALANPTPPAE